MTEAQGRYARLLAKGYQSQVFTNLAVGLPRNLGKSAREIGYQERFRGLIVFQNGDRFRMDAEITSNSDRERRC